MDNNIDTKTLNYFILMKAIHNELFQDMIILNNHELIQRKASIMRLQLKKDERKSPPSVGFELWSLGTENQCAAN